MKLPVQPPVKPMLAKLTRELPSGDDLFYEPKWDGFRCIVFRDGDQVTLGSRNEKPMDRYFPELCDSLRANLPERCVVDGEIVIATDHGLDFDALQLRIHPAASRIRLLSKQIPSSFVAFDVLALDDQDLRRRPFAERRATLETALAGVKAPVHLTPATRDRPAWPERRARPAWPERRTRHAWPERRARPAWPERRATHAGRRRQPVERRQGHVVGAGATGAGRRGRLRPSAGRSVSPCHLV